MKLLKNTITVNAGEENNFLIHPYMGDIYVVGKNEIDLVKKWSEMEEITCEKNEEKNFLEQLVQKKFIVAGETEEKLLEEKTMELARTHHNLQHQNLNSAVFVITYACNFACPYCYEEGALENTTKIMTEEMVDAVFDLYNGKIDKIALYGGEPLLPENKKIIEYIISKAPQAEYNVTSNGYYIVEYFQLLRSLKINNIMITLDGSKELHNKTRILKDDRKKGTFDKILEGIELLLRNNINVKIRMNISDKNKDDCLELRDKFITKYPFQFQNGILKFELQPIFQLSSKKRDELNEELVYNLYDKKNSGYYNTMAISVTPILDSFVNRRRNFVPRYTFCDAEGARRFFDAEGNIYSCILALKNKKASVGTYYPKVNMKKDSMLTRNIERIEKCQTCKFKFLCGGGCANGIIDKDGDVMKPNCTILNEVYNVLPKLFSERLKSK